MKRLITSVMIACILFISCKSEDKKTTTNVAQTEADTLYKEVLDEHNEGMSGWMKIEGIQKKIKDLQDSIAKFPSSEHYSTLKTKLNEVNSELSEAYKKMDTWMTNELNLDSAADNVKMRIQYLKEQKIKGSTITALINNSLQKADSLLKSKF